MTTPRVVMVLTSHDRFGDTGRPTGFWFEELAAPYYVLRDGGVDVTLASPAGGKPPADPASLTPDTRTPDVDRFLADAEAAGRLAATERLDSLHVDDADAVFLVGGHGTMWDFPAQPQLATLVATVAAHGGAVGSVCHGAAGLLDVVIDGRPLIEGRALAAFSDAEEQLVGATDLVPFSLQRHLHARGARYTEGAPFQPHAVRDGQLVTGQNPASSRRTAVLLIEALRSPAATDTRP
ncbi:MULTISPECIES: type 1 glutamine amidotransferase domain-containing protein [unclassified Frankia]|uniref:type 1 glutamine amidotransferase domain-containing protein n=1 Tax=unclassified Frankia TaxID=2632575 RepID=UPI002AD445D4|nr:MULTISPECIES: type 1 glutamine amidotransferase domain-containing protein [unclassified Frankia]